MNGQEGEIRACPGCGKTDGVARTDSPFGVDAWRCAACSMSWAVTVVNPRPQLADLGSAVEEIGALRWVLRAVVTLAEQAPALADGALRNRLAGRGLGADQLGAFRDHAHQHRSPLRVSGRPLVEAPDSRRPAGPHCRGAVVSPQQPRPVHDRWRDATGIHLDDGYDPPRNIEQIIAALRALAAEHGVNHNSPQGEGEP